METVRFELRPPRPYSLDRTVARLVRFPESVNRVEGGVYGRLLQAPGAPLLLQVRQQGPPSRPLLEVTLRGRRARTAGARAVAEQALGRLLGATTAVAPFYRAAREDSLIAPLLRRYRGLRVAGYEDVFEALVTAVLAQQIRLDVAYRIRRDLCEAYGRPARVEGRRWLAFPRPARLARAGAETLRGFGLSRSKARALGELAEAFASGDVTHEGLANLDDESAIDRLVGFHGVGRWTAEVALLRGLGRMDAFPGADLAVVKYLAVDLLGHGAPASERVMRDLAERWRPWRGLALAYALEEISRSPRQSS